MNMYPGLCGHTDDSGFASLQERQAAHAARGIPVFWVFTSQLLYRQVAGAASTAVTRLDPLAIAVIEDTRLRRGGAKPFVDLAYTEFTTYPFLKVATPASLLFYQPGTKRHDQTPGVSRSCFPISLNHAHRGSSARAGDR